MSACCTDFEKRGRYLFANLRSVGCKLPAYCPWCGKGVTDPPVRSVLPLFVSPRASVSVQTKGWPAGNPSCQRCRGRGFAMKREGCCKLIAVPCPCTLEPTTGGQA